VLAYWQLWLLTDDGGRKKCACLLTTVAEQTVPAYWQWWQNEMCLLTNNRGRTKCACLLTIVAEWAVPACWQWWQNELWLFTDNGGGRSCACLLTMVAKRAVPAYWQRWQKEMCLLTDNGGWTKCACLLTKGGRISPSVVSTSDSNAGQSEFEARPSKYSTFVQAISWIYSVSFGITWDSTLLRGPVKSTEILSGRYRKIRICIL
jgi:hypothetical protein